MLTVTAALPQRVLALDPAKALNEYRYDAWEEAEGLPHYSVNSIVQGKDGYLFLATYYGIVRFDGKQFRVFDRNNTPALKSNQIWCLAVDREGTLWAGTSAGLISYRNGVWAKQPGEGITDASIHSLHLASDGALWIGTTASGAVVLRSGVFHTVGPSREMVRSLLVDRSGTTWIGTNNGLFRYSDGKMEHFTKADGIPNERVLSLQQTRDGVIYVGTAVGLAYIKDQDIRTIRLQPELSTQLMWSLAEDRDGQVWVGTLGDGLARINAGKVDWFKNPRRASSNAITAVYEDREGSLWVGASGGGLGQLHNVPFHTLTTDDGLTGNLVQAVLRARDGTVWVGTNGFGLNHITQEGRVLKTLSKKTGLPSNDIWCLHEDHAGSIWAGGYNGNLAHISKSGIRIYDQRDGLPEKPILSVEEDSHGAIWAGTLGAGLVSLSGGKARTYTTTDGLAANHVRIVHEDHKGRLLIGTEKGLSVMEDGKFSNYGLKDGLAGAFIFSIFEEPDGTLWLGSFDGGLTRMQNGRFVKYDLAAGFPAITVFGQTDDGRGNFWFSSSTGIFRISKQELNDYAAGRTNHISSSAFGMADGLLSRECNGGQPAAATTSDGRIWFPTMKGLAFADPGRISLNMNPPPVDVSRIRADGVEKATTSNIQLPVGTRTLEIEYTGLSLVAPDKVQFRYRLTPFDKDFVEAGTRRVAMYTNLPPGQYDFQVLASNNDGIWNNTGTTIKMELPPHFYQTSLFVFLCFAALAGLVWLGHSFRLRALKTLNQELEQRVAERTQSLEDSNREMSSLIANLEVARAQAEEASRVRSEFVANVSHEIRTPLNGILGLVGLTLTTQLTCQQEEYLRLTAQSADSLLYVLNDVLDFSRIDAGHLSIDSHPFHPRQVVEDAVKLLLPGAVEKGLQLKSDVSPQVPQIVLGDAVRLRQILLNLIGNAVKFTESGGVEVSCGSYTEGAQHLTLEFRVKDSGIGITPEKQNIIFEPFRQADNSTTRKYGGTGLGLAISTRLISAMHGNIGVESVPGTGSTFTFRIPVTRADAMEVPFSDSLANLSNNALGLHVLLAEDNKINQKVAKTLLEKLGCTAEVVENGRQAIDNIESHQYDVVLMDIQMPEMDGISAIQEIRRREANLKSHLPVIALTAHAMEGDAQRCIAAGMDGYLAKPINVTQLAAVLGRYAKRRTATPDTHIGLGI